MRFILPTVLVPALIGFCFVYFVCNTTVVTTIVKFSFITYFIGYLLSLCGFTFLAGDDIKAHTIKHKFQWGLVFSIVWPWCIGALICDTFKHKKRY